MDAPDEPELGPLYALETTLYATDDTVTSYVTLMDTLDITELPQDEAREFPGYSVISSIDGKLLVSDGESPTITSYDIMVVKGVMDDTALSNERDGLRGAGFRDASRSNLLTSSNVAALLTWG